MEEAAAAAPRIRAKFRVSEKITHDYGWRDPEGKPISAPVTVVLHPVGDDGIPENQRFHKATPAGKLELQIDSPATAATFVVGAYYYLDFTPIVLSTPIPAPIPAGA